MTQSEEDAALYSKMRRFNWVTLANFELGPQLIDTGTVPYYMAIAKLRAMNYCTTPTKKLWCICDAAKALHEQIFVLT